jgi:acyl-CoA thioester hydrolase
LREAFGPVNQTAVTTWKVELKRTTQTVPARWFSTPLRVRYAETDKMSVVYCANYFVWFEVGRTDLCRQCGFSYRDMEAEDDAYLMVVSADCRYRRPARYEDDLLIKTSIASFTSRTMKFEYEVIAASNEDLIAEGSTSHVVTSSLGRPRSFPSRQAALLRAALLAPDRAGTVS